jgi:hypothetical protein
MSGEIADAQEAQEYLFSYIIGDYLEISADEAIERVKNMLDDTEVLFILSDNCYDGYRKKYFDGRHFYRKKAFIDGQCVRLPPLLWMCTLICESNDRSFRLFESAVRHLGKDSINSQYDVHWFVDEDASRGVVTHHTLLSWVLYWFRVKSFNQRTARRMNSCNLTQLCVLIKNGVDINAPVTEEINMTSGHSALYAALRYKIPRESVAEMLNSGARLLPDTDFDIMFTFTKTFEKCEYFVSLFRDHVDALSNMHLRCDENGRSWMYYYLARNIGIYGSEKIVDIMKEFHFLFKIPILDKDRKTFVSERMQSQVKDVMRNIDYGIQPDSSLRIDSAERIITAAQDLERKELEELEKQDHKRAALATGGRGELKVLEEDLRRLIRKFASKR